MATIPKHEREARAATQTVLDDKPPLALRLIRRGLMTLVVLALLGIGYSAYWFLIATSMKDGVPAWLADRAGPALSFNYKQIEISGYPFTFRIIFHQPSAGSTRLLAAPGGESWRWRAGKVIAEMKPWNFNHFELNLSGTHDFSFNLPNLRGRYRGSVERALIETEIRDDGIPRFINFDLRGLGLKGVRKGENITAGDVKISARRRFPEPVTNKTATFVLDLDGKEITTPASLRWPLGQKIALMKGKARLMGELRNPQSLSSIEAWRDDGGIVELEAIEAKCGPLTVLTNGTLALDKNLQIQGALSARFQGFFATIDRLKKQQVIRLRDAAMAKLVLGVLSRRPSGGGPAVLSLPVNVENGKVTAQGLTLLEIGLIQWPEDWNDLGGLRRLN
jgi:hypothetical protein